jgi:methylaspartate ammonia-lyase
MGYIVRVLGVPTVGAGYSEDLAALQAAYVPVADRFSTPPQTPGYRAVGEPAEALSIGLVLEGGRVAWGDCVGSSYSGLAGRREVFRAGEGLETVRQVVAPALEGQQLTTFRGLANAVDRLTQPVEVAHRLPSAARQPRQREVSRRDLLASPARLLRAAREGGKAITERVVEDLALHPAIRYGVSQALLEAVALENGITPAEVIAREWRLQRPSAVVPLHAQSGPERFRNAEKMIVRRIASLPHASVDNVDEQLGSDGAEMTHYIRWLSQRIRELGGEGYAPTIHLDLHGRLGHIHDHNPGRMLGQLYAWEQAARPYRLRIESPVLLENRERQIEVMKTLRDYVRLRQMAVQLVADEWANTLDDIQAFVDSGAADMIQITMPDVGSMHEAVEAVLCCKAAGVEAFLGGSYAETCLSARASVHVALATRPSLLMAKPGLGVDEAISLAQNEMARTLAEIEAVRPQAPGQAQEIG